MKFAIDEELWYGLGSDEEAEARAAQSLAARMGRIIGAKPFPVAAQKLTQITQNAECSMDEVVEVLESDPALSARVLRLVNSVGFSLRTACTSVRHAATLVGISKLNQVASTAAILDMYDSSSKRAAAILEHATVVGALCRYLAFHFALPPDELFTCGFLHDIGKLMLLDTAADEYVELLDDCSGKQDAVYVREREIFGFDHALLAGHVLAAWNIPHPVPKVVAWHHHVTRAYAESSQISQMVSTLRLADAMSFALDKADPMAQIESLARTEAASYLDISGAQLAAMWPEVMSLARRARAGFRGKEPSDDEPQLVTKPSRESLRAVEKAGKTEPLPSGPHSERPKQFPCVVCDAPSYAHKCAACRGYVCPVHLNKDDEWCTLCQGAYREAGIPEIRPAVSTVLGATLGTLLAAAFFGAASAGAQRPLRLMVGPTLILMLVGMLAGVSHRWFRRWWFLRTRPDRNSIVPPSVADMLGAASRSIPRISERLPSASAPPAAQSTRPKAKRKKHRARSVAPAKGGAKGKAGASRAPKASGKPERRNSRGAPPGKNSLASPRDEPTPQSPPPAVASVSWPPPSSRPAGLLWMSTGPRNTPLPAPPAAPEAKGAAIIGGAAAASTSTPATRRSAAPPDETRRAAGGASERPGSRFAVEPSSQAPKARKVEPEAAEAGPASSEPELEVRSELAGDSLLPPSSVPSSAARSIPAPSAPADERPEASQRAAASSPREDEDPRPVPGGAASRAGSEDVAEAEEAPTPGSSDTRAAHGSESRPRDAVHEDAGDERALDEDAGDEHALDEDAVDEDAGDEHAVDAAEAPQPPPEAAREPAADEATGAAEPASERPGGEAGSDPPDAASAAGRASAGPPRLEVHAPPPAEPFAAAQSTRAPPSESRPPAGGKEKAGPAVHPSEPASDEPAAERGAASDVDPGRDEPPAGDTPATDPDDFAPGAARDSSAPTRLQDAGEVATPPTEPSIAIPAEAPPGSATPQSTEARPEAAEARSEVRESLPPPDGEPQQPPREAAAESNAPDSGWISALDDQGSAEGW